MSGRLLDMPNEWSSHTTVTPRGGGIVPAVIISVVTAVWWVGPRGHFLAGTLVAAVAMGALGLVDDTVGQGPLMRLSGQVVIAVVAAALLTEAMHRPPAVRLLALVIAAGWLVAFVNAFNFMDGIEGISAVTAAGAGIIWLVLGTWQHDHVLEATAAATVGGALGLQPFNFPRARVFLGDAGSYFSGGMLGAGLLVALRSGLHPEVVVSPLELYVLDTGVTLVHRLLRGENVFDAHRNHVYQRMCAAGWSHPQTAGWPCGTPLTHSSLRWVSSIFWVLTGRDDAVGCDRSTGDDFDRPAIRPAENLVGRDPRGHVRGRRGRKEF